MRKGNRLRLDAVAPGASYMQLSINKIKIWCSLQVRREIIRVFIYNLKKRNKSKIKLGPGPQTSKNLQAYYLDTDTHTCTLSIKAFWEREREREREREEMKRVREMG